MKKNQVILFGLLILCAVAARYLLTQKEARVVLAQDITTALELLWKNRGHRVELVPVSGGLQARVRVSLPEKNTAQRKQWNFSLLHFVAQRRSSFTLTLVELVDASTGKPVEPVNRRLATSSDRDSSESSVCAMLVVDGDRPGHPQSLADAIR